MDRPADPRFAAAVAINQEIATHARRKELTAAMQLFDRAVATDAANMHTFAAAVNCNVRCGNLAGALAIYDKLKAKEYKKGFRPDTIICTTLLKGICEAGNIPRALELFGEMQGLKVVPNIRTVNTFLRGCVWVGAVDQADQMVARMQREFQLVPDVSTWEYLVALLCQALRLEKVLPLLGRLKSDAGMRSGLCAMHVRLAGAAALLGDLKASRRALVAAKEALQAEEAAGDGGHGAGGGGGDGLDAESDDEEGAQRAASGGKRAWKTVSDATRSESNVLFRQHRRAELRQEMTELEAFVETCAAQARVSAPAGGSNSSKQSLLLPFFRRLLSFASQPSDGASGSSTSSSTADQVVDGVLAAARTRFGLDACLLRQASLEAVAASAPPVAASVGDKGKGKNKSKKRKSPETSCGADAAAAAATAAAVDSTAPPPVPPAIASSISQFRTHLANCFDAAGLVDFSRVFSTPSADSAVGATPSRSPVNLEICSGAGEWAVAQARADPASNWATLELRHDRVHQTFSRAVCAGANNLCVMGGDATQVLPTRIAPNTFRRVFVNHPEPPQQTGGRGGEAFYASEGRHLLTPGFLHEVVRVLEPNGMLVIATDNQWYARFLLRQFAADGTPPASRLLRSAELEKRKVLESESGVSLFEGRPGAECGVCAEAASSYFDRLWNRVQISERFFLAFVKNPDANSSSIRLVVSGAGGGAGAAAAGLSKSLKKIKREGLLVAAQGKKIRFGDDD